MQIYARYTNLISVPQVQLPDREQETTASFRKRTLFIIRVQEIKDIIKTGICSIIHILHHPRNSQWVRRVSWLKRISTCLGCILRTLTRRLASPAIIKINIALRSSLIGSIPLMTLIACLWAPCKTWLMVSKLFHIILSGIALCHLVGQIACSTEDQDKIKQLVYYEATSETSSAVNELALQNVDLAINILKSSNLPLTQEIQTLQPEDVFAGGFNSAALLLFLEALKSISDMITFGSKPHLAP